jgi:carbon-monoxide dehydrogenase large subunit
MAPCPLEPRSALARRDPDGRLTAWLSTQAPHQDRDGLAATLGLEPSQIRVVSPDVGGGFGAKLLSVEEILTVWLAARLDGPVHWTETRSESMVALGHGRGMHLSFTIGGTRDGRILAYRLSALQDGGAYPVVGCFLPGLTGLMSSGVYAIPRIEFEGCAVVTNTTPVTAFRGAGRPEACQAIERAIDVFAAEAGLDPVEVRRRNFIPKDSFPHTTASHATYDSGDYEGALDLALEASGYEELRAEQARRRERGGAKQLGIGVSTYIEITNALPEAEFGQVEIAADGTATLRTGSFSHGQGHETTFAQIASDRLGIPFESITVVKGDTDVIPRGTGTYGSKSTQLGGTAARLAADDVVAKARELAADYLEASVEDVELDAVAGRFQVVGAPQRGFSWQELAGRAADAGTIDTLNATSEFQSTPTFPFGCHVAVVEVDTETGQVELLRLVAVDDAGTVINPLIFEGQVHGGVATGVAQAMYEQFVYDEDGNPLTASFLGYAFPSAAELPSWETAEMQTPTPVNPLGAKGIGESGTMGSTPAVQSAVIDALAPYGVRHVDMPVNGENVWRALREAGA